MSIIIDHDNVQPAATGDRWTPIRNGEIFCSPACGGQCKRVDFDHVSAQAGVLAAKLGRGWMPIVWENLGWYFKVQKGAATVRINSKGNFEACVEVNFIDNSTAQILQSHRDPRRAVELANDIVRSKIETLKRTLASTSLESLEIQDV